MKYLTEILYTLATILFVGSGIAFYYLFPSVKDLPNNNPSRINEFQRVEIPEFRIIEAEWPEAQEQAKNELYDLFTPPEIYLNSRGEFVFRSPYFVAFNEPFGVGLENITQDLYRFQLDGFAKTNNGNSDEIVILMHSVKDGKSIRMKPGSSNNDYGFKILEWSTGILDEDSSNMKFVAGLKLYDLQEDKIFYLRQDQELLEEKITVELVVEDSGERHILESIDSSFFLGEIEYRLDAIDVDNNTILLTKIIPDNDPITESLTAVNVTDFSNEESSFNPSSDLDMWDDFDF